MLILAKICVFDQTSKTAENIFYTYINKFMDYIEVCFSKSTFHEKAKKKSTGYRSKTPILAKIYIF